MLAELKGLRGMAKSSLEESQVRSVVHFQVQRKRKGSRAANISSHTLDEKSHFCCSDGEPGAIFSCCFFPFFKPAGWSLCPFPTSNCKTQALVKKAGFFCERSYKMCPPRKTGTSDQFWEALLVQRRRHSKRPDPGTRFRFQTFFSCDFGSNLGVYFFFSEEEMLKERK